MSILLNDTPLPGFDHRLTVQEQIVRKDASGENSTTATTFGGWKAAVLSIRLLIRWADIGDLEDLRKLWHKQEPETGAPAIFRITHDMTHELWITRVRFTDFFKVAPKEKEQMWEVSLTLIEADSIPEKRVELADETTPETEPTTPAGAANPDGTAAEAVTATGQFEKLVARFDKWAGKSLFGEEEELPLP